MDFTIVFVSDSTFQLKSAELKDPQELAHLKKNNLRANLFTQKKSEYKKSAKFFLGAESPQPNKGGPPPIICFQITLFCLFPLKPDLLDFKPVLWHRFQLLWHRFTHNAIFICNHRPHLQISQLTLISFLKHKSEKWQTVVKFTLYV